MIGPFAGKNVARVAGFFLQVALREACLGHQRRWRMVVETPPTPRIPLGGTPPTPLLATGNDAPDTFFTKNNCGLRMSPYMGLHGHKARARSALPDERQ